MSEHHKSHPDYAAMGAFAGYGEHETTTAAALGDGTTGVPNAETAANLRAHVSTLAAAKISMSLRDWNNIASDILDAADVIQSQAALVAERDALRKALTDLCDAWDWLPGHHDGGAFRGNMTEAQYAAREALKVTP